MSSSATTALCIILFASLVKTRAWSLKKPSVVHRFLITIFYSRMRIRWLVRVVYWGWATPRTHDFRCRSYSPLRFTYFDGRTFLSIIAIFSGIYIYIYMSGAVYLLLVFLVYAESFFFCVYFVFGRVSLCVFMEHCRMQW
ncbi:unnamed protein product [Ixodes pacificus]